MANKNLPVIKLGVSDIDDESPAVTFTALVDSPAIESNFMAFSNEPIEKFEFKITDSERRIITGAAMIPNKKIYRRDDDGSEYFVEFDPDTIETIVKKWAKQGFHNRVNLMHSAQAQPDGVHLMESMIVDSKRGMKAPSVLGEFPDSTWIHSYFVENDQVWALIKEGKIKGFSVEGFFDTKSAFAKFKSEHNNETEKLLSELESYLKK